MNIHSLTKYLGRRAIRSAVGHLLGRPAIDDLTGDQRREMWPPAVALQQQHIQNCRLIVDRDELLKLIPKGGVCAEVGIMYCDFSQKILETTEPRKLHLIDIETGPVEIAKKRFSKEIASDRVEVHKGDSAACLLQFPPNYFDWVYIDGDHRYEGVKKDLEASHSRLKPDGLIVMNDYQYFSIVEFMKYGVIEAVNEFCIQYGYEMLYMALQGRTYNDVLLKRLSTATSVNALP